MNQRQFKQGDLIVRKTLFGFRKQIFNGYVGNHHMLVGSHNWNGLDYRARNCKVVKVIGWFKVH